MTTNFALALRSKPINWWLWKDNSAFRISSNWFGMSRVKTLHSKAFVKMLND